MPGWGCTTAFGSGRASSCRVGKGSRARLLVAKPKAREPFTARLAVRSRGSVACIGVTSCPIAPHLLPFLRTLHALPRLLLAAGASLRLRQSGRLGSKLHRAGQQGGLKGTATFACRTQGHNNVVNAAHHQCTHRQSVEVTAGHCRKGAAAGGAGRGRGACLGDGDRCQAHWKPSCCRSKARPGNSGSCSQAQHRAVAGCERVSRYDPASRQSIVLQTPPTCCNNTRRAESEETGWASCCPGGDMPR